MAPATRLNQTQMEQVRELITEEFNNAFNQLIPNVTTDIINQVHALLDERLTAVHGGALPAPPVRDSPYYFEKFSKCHPPQWNGDLNPVEAKHWIADIESALMTCGCPDQYKVVVAMSQLRKKANTWWKTVTTLMTEDELRAMTWAQFVERFEGQYVPKVEQQRMQQQFMALEQTTESVSDLNAKFLEMLSFCPSFAGNEPWLVSRYADALRTEIREFVSMQEFTTLSAIMDAARRREIELQTQQLKRKADNALTKTSGDAHKKQKNGGKTRYEYRPSGGQDDKSRLVCYNCKKLGHHWKHCKSSAVVASPQVPSTVPTCFNCNEKGHKKPDCPQLKNGGGGGGTKPASASSFKGPTMVTRGRAHQLTAGEPAITATVAGTYLLDSEPAAVMFDSGATHSFVSRTFINRLGRSIGKLARPMVIEVADNRMIYVTDVYRGCTLEFSGVEFPIDLIPIAMRELCVIVGMDWLDAFDAEIHCRKKQIRVQNPKGGELIIQGDTPRLAVASCSSAKVLNDVPVVSDFSNVFPEELPGLPPIRQVEFRIDLLSGATPIAKAPYRLAPPEMKEL
ncbi:hypothetical protein L1887_32131 [Cichorium endivia]|nr:hypothetical protein L1887_32131 [Cichorium endivia]